MYLQVRGRVGGRGRGREREREREILQQVVDIELALQIAAEKVRGGAGAEGRGKAAGSCRCARRAEYWVAQTGCARTRMFPASCAPPLPPRARPCMRE